MLPGVDCVKSTAPDHTNLQVTRMLGASAKQRRTFLLSGFSPDGEYAVYNNTLHCAERAVKERVFFVKRENEFSPPPKPVNGHFGTTLSGVFKHLKKHALFSNPMEAEAFAMSYQAPKQKVYLRAVRSLQIKPYGTRDSYIQAFTKCEKYKFSVKVPVPRIIQPRSPRYNVCVGRYLKPIEKKIYENINQLFGSKTIMKGLNQIERASVIESHFNSFEQCVAIGLDASRFDQHVSREALEWEHSVYNLYYHSKSLRTLLKQQLRNKCFINLPEGMIKYTTDGCRMSGDINTSLGNCLLMSCMVYAYSQQQNCRIKLVNDGDDCVVFLAKKDLHKFMINVSSWFLTMGFTLTVEDPVYELEKIAFCQSRPIYVGSRYVMVRDPRKVLSKDSISLRPINQPKLARRWLAAVGAGGLSMTGGVPVLQEFYAACSRASTGAKPLNDFDMSRRLILADGMQLEYEQPSARTRYSFYLAFGIDPACQRAIEGIYRNLTIGSAEVKSITYLDLPIDSV